MSTRRNLPSPWEIAVIVLGVAISVVSGILLRAVVPTLLGVVLTMQLELLIRANSLQSAWVKWEPILGAVRSGSPTWSDATERMIKSLSHLERSTTDEGEFLPAATSRLEATAAFIQHCAEGTMVAQRSDVDIMFKFADLARDSIRAVTSYRDLTWWMSKPGVEFLRIQKAALSKVPSLTIERVMIVRGDEPDAHEIALMGELSSVSRMKVSWVPSDVATADGSDINVTIVDDRFAHRDTEIGADQPRGHHYSVKRDEVDAAIRDFKKLGIHAVAFEPST